MFDKVFEMFETSKFSLFMFSSFKEIFDKNVFNHSFVAESSLNS